MSTILSVTTAPKTSTFQMRINPEIKERMDAICAKCGITFTDAINMFIQQTLNAEGMPFIVGANNKELLRSVAIAQLMGELKKGAASVKQESDWVSEEEMLAEFGVEE